LCIRRSAPPRTTSNHKHFGVTPIVARAGYIQLAEELARTAVARVRETEAPSMQADTPSRDVEGVLA